MMEILFYLLGGVSGVFLMCALILSKTREK